MIKCKCNLFLPEIELVLLLSSMPLMALRGMRRAQSSVLLQCRFARVALLPVGVIHASRPGLVGSRPFQRQRLTELLDRLPLPCITWPSCKPTRPRRWSSCTKAVLTQVWCRSCARWWTLPFGQRKSRRGPSVRRCPLWWSKSATYGWTWQIWGNWTSTASWTPRSPRQASSVTRWRAWLRLPPHRSGRRWSDKKAFPGGPMLSPPSHRLYVVMEKLWSPFIYLVQTDSKS